MSYRVETYTIDTARREVAQGGACVAVEPKVFDLLLYLIENRDRVVDKRELVDKIWDGRVVSEAALYSCIKAARRAIGDDGQQQRLIRTLPRRGFRFVGPVQAAGEEALQPSVLSGGPGGEGAGRDSDTDALPADSPLFDLDLKLPRRPSIAVLPIHALSDEEGHGLLAEGLGHEITIRLARTRWLFVTARASAAKFSAPELDAVEIGRQLGVRYLLRGTLTVADGRLRLAVILSDATHGCEIWAERFERKVDDLFAVQDEIGDLMVAAVEAEIEQNERQCALLRPFASLDAWSAYHRACHYLFQYLPEHHEQAEEALKLAARLDPSSPRVFAALSFLHWQRAFLEITPDREGELMQALDHARHAVSLDPLEPQGHWALGRGYLLQGEVEEAIEELRATVALNPNFANGQYSLAFAYGMSGECEPSLDGIAKARRLSPYDPMTFAFMSQRAATHGLAGESERAAEWSARAVLQPGAHYHLLAIAAWCHQIAARNEQAQDYLARLRAVRPGYSRDDYFRAFAFRPKQRALIETVFSDLGL